MKPKYGFEINTREGGKLVTIPASPDLKKYFDEEIFPKKDYIDYLKEFLITEENYIVVSGAVERAMKDCLPECVKSECKYCNGQSDKENDMACNKYYLQMRLTFMMAANEFIHIVIRHNHIYENKKVLFNLTQDFYRSFRLIKGKGLMYFDLENMCRCILNAGFISLSEMFVKSKPLQNLGIINDTIDDIEKQKLENEIFEKADEDYLELQHKFFENKQRYYKEKLFLEEQGLTALQPIKPKSVQQKEKKISVIVLYYYYLQAGGYFPYFENHSEGKLKAIKELIVNDKINTTAKYFQIKYNLISGYKSNRIAKNKASNIEYVANQMLNNYPKSKEIALNELKEAQTKNR